jgi:hypothetical protein
VEVALQTLRGTPDAGSRTSLIAVAEGMLQSATAAFAQADCGRGDEPRHTGVSSISPTIASDRQSKARMTTEVPFGTDTAGSRSTATCAGNRAAMPRCRVC